MWQNVQSVYVILKVRMWKTLTNFNICEDQWVRIANTGLFWKRSVCCILVTLLFFFSKVCSWLNSISTVQVVSVHFKHTPLFFCLQLFCAKRLEI